MFQKIIYWLNQPFPIKNGISNSMRSGLISGFIVSFLLFAFKPFGMHQIIENQWLHCLGFGIITFLVSILFDFVVNNILKIKIEESKWTFGKWILSTLIVLLLITIANSLYSYYLYNNPLSTKNFLGTLMATSLVGIFPIATLGGLHLNANLRNYQKIAESLNEQTETKPVAKKVVIPTKGSSKVFEIEVSKFLYAASMQNYVQIFYKSPEGIKKEVIRNTLIEVSKALAETSVIKCHRSFLVNKDQVTKISGNAQGLLLSLDSITDFQVPVSRKYIPLFK